MHAVRRDAFTYVLNDSSVDGTTGSRGLGVGMWGMGMVARE